MNGFEFGTIALTVALIAGGCGGSKDGAVVSPQCRPAPIADAGPDKIIQLEKGLPNFVILGGKDSNGACFWTPSDGLDNPTFCNPMASPTKETTYKLTVTNKCGSQSDDVTVRVYAE